MFVSLDSCGNMERSNCDDNNSSFTQCSTLPVEIHVELRDSQTNSQDKVPISKIKTPDRPKDSESNNPKVSFNPEEPKENFTTKRAVQQRAPVCASDRFGNRSPGADRRRGTRSNYSAKEIRVPVGYKGRPVPKTVIQIGRAKSWPAWRSLLRRTVRV